LRLLTRYHHPPADIRIKPTMRPNAFFPSLKRRREDGVGVGEAAGRLTEFGEIKRR
jgi:hypothetical protein